MLIKLKKMRVILSPISKYILSFVMASIAFGFATESQAQFAIEYTRTEPTGHWRDGNWHTPIGLSDIVPPIDADVYIAESGLFAESFSPAIVDVYTTDSAKNLFVGPSVASGSTESGMVLITTGEAVVGTTTTGNLTITDTTRIRRGSVDIDTGSVFSTNTLSIEGANSSLTTVGTVNVDSATVAGGDLDISTGVFNSTGQILITSGMINIDSAGTLTSDSLRLDGANVDLRGTVNVNTVEIVNGGVLTIDTNTVMNLDNVSANSATINLNSDAHSSMNFAIDSGTLNLNAGELSVDAELSLTDSVVNRSGADLSVLDLEVGGTTNLAVTLADQISGAMTIVSGGTVSYDQAVGSELGMTSDSLSIDATSQLLLNFDAVELGEFGEILDWGYRVVGDQQAALQALLDDGRVIGSGNVMPLEIFYDVAEHGDFTYIGFTAVPEPGSIAILSLLGLGAITRRRRG